VPKTRDFLVATDEGRFSAWELWRLAKALGESPRKLLKDPDLGFNLTVMRGHDRWKRDRRNKAFHEVINEDGFGLKRIFEAIRQLGEDD
jgi:hypothetical protein